MLGKKWLALFAIGIGLALAVSACGGSDNKKDNGVVVSGAGGLPADITPISTPQGVPTPAGPPASDSDIQAIADAFAKVKSFRSTLTAGPANSQQTTTIEMSYPDKVHITIKTATGTQELICANNLIYTKTDKWVKNEKDPTGKAVDCTSYASSIFNTKTIGDGLKASAANISKGGTDTVNGKKCQILQQVNPNGSTADICVADGLPIRIVDKGAGATIIFSDYNANIDIKAPI